MKKQTTQLFYDDVEIGDVFETVTRTITDTDIMQFAGLTGDFSEIHTSDTFAAETAYGGRIAHGMLTLSIANGLYTRLPYFPDTVFVEIKNWRFYKPVLIGDTIKLIITLLDKRVTRNSKRGLFTWQYNLYNQYFDLIADGELSRLVTTKEEE